MRTRKSLFNFAAFSLLAVLLLTACQSYPSSRNHTLPQHLAATDGAMSGAEKPTSQQRQSTSFFVKSSIFFYSTHVSSILKK